MAPILKNWGLDKKPGPISFIAEKNTIPSKNLIEIIISLGYNIFFVMFTRSYSFVKLCVYWTNLNINKQERGECMPAKYITNIDRITQIPEEERKS